jgi:hypothetical protein
MRLQRIGSRLRVFALLPALLLTACSFQQSLDAVVSHERQAALIATARAACADAASLQSQFAPERWADVEPTLAELRGQCPRAGGTDWRLTTFQFNSATTAAGTPSRREYAVAIAGGGAGPWTEVELNYEQIGTGPMQIIGVNVRRLNERPQSLVFAERWEQVRLWGAVGLAVLALLLMGLVIWLVRRSRRRGGLAAP